MSSLRAPGLGPIVGHTTSNSCRIWIKGGDSADEGGSLNESRRTIGVITVLDSKGKPDSKDPTRTQYFRLHRKYDRTGTFDLGKEFGLNGGQELFELTPNTSYRVRLGTLSLDDVFANVELEEDADIARFLPEARVWAEPLAALPADSSEAVIKTFAEEDDNTLSFILGSCRYPGLPFRKKYADQIFRPVLNHLTNNPYGIEPRFLLMVGDQIYADPYNPTNINKADTYKEFQERYHAAFGSQNLRRLLRQVPTYMILDDHEIEDNWTQDRVDDLSKHELFNLAIGAYMSYQWSHGPRNYEGRLFYDFECDGFPFFVLDARTQRYKDDEPGLDDNHMLGRPSFDPVNEPSELDHLCTWLGNQKKMHGDRPKFIISPSVFVPNMLKTAKGNAYKEKSDSWPAYPETRRSLLNYIISNQIQNVVFLSGDVHCSNVAELNFHGSQAAQTLKAFSITSSAFYWPFWFADGEPSHFVHDSKLQNDTFVISDKPKITMDYKAYNFTQKDNFCQIDIDWPNKQIEVQTIDQKGKLIVNSILQLA